MAKVKNIMISACLLGLACRYDGQAKEYDKVEKLLKEEGIRLIPFCPEQLGGLPTPRYPSEIRDGRLINDHGQDVTDSFLRGAREALKLCRIYGAEMAVLKEKSPSCGNGQVYDGSFSGRLVEGRGITADLLIRQGIEVFGESDLDRLLLALKDNEN